MNYELSDITWDPPRPLDASCEPSVRQGLAYEVGQLDPDDAPVPNDFYFWGGTVAAHSRLALIA
jgi:endo-1,3(4)-beta-glucanase